MYDDLFTEFQGFHTASALWEALRNVFFFLKKETIPDYGLTNLLQDATHLDHSVKLHIW